MSQFKILNLDSNTNPFNTTDADFQSVLQNPEPTKAPKLMVEVLDKWLDGKTQKAVVIHECDWDGDKKAEDAYVTRELQADGKTYKEKLQYWSSKDNKMLTATPTTDNPVTSSGTTNAYAVDVPVNGVFQGMNDRIVASAWQEQANAGISLFLAVNCKSLGLPSVPEAPFEPYKPDEPLPYGSPEVLSRIPAGVVVDLDADYDAAVADYQKAMKKYGQAMKQYKKQMDVITRYQARVDGLKKDINADGVSDAFLLPSEGSWNSWIYAKPNLSGIVDKDDSVIKLSL